MTRTRDGTIRFPSLSSLIRDFGLGSVSGYPHVKALQRFVLIYTRKYLAPPPLSFASVHRQGNDFVGSLSEPARPTGCLRYRSCEPPRGVGCRRRSPAAWDLVSLRDPAGAPYCPRAFHHNRIVTGLANVLGTHASNIMSHIGPYPQHNRSEDLKRVIVTPAVYPRLDEPLHFDIQSTGQKSHCVNINL